jgi:hypothetical protein
MTLINSVFSFINKYKLIILIIVVLLYVGFYYKYKEGFTATSCTQFTNCAECVNGKVIDSSSPCYWSSEKNKCGSFNDSGYSRLCYPTPEPTPEPAHTPTPLGPCPICKTCPELTMLKNPTFITKQ